jgi:hypothetical protein
MTKDEMIGLFKSAPMGSRHQRMLWLPTRSRSSLGLPNLSNAVVGPDRGRETARSLGIQ